MICSTHAVGLRCMIFSIKWKGTPQLPRYDKQGPGGKQSDDLSGKLIYEFEIDEEGTIKVKPPLSKAGDKIVFRAEIDVRVGIAACSVAESPCNSGVCTSIQVIVDRE